MKDFYDLHMLAERFTFDGATLAAAIAATFARRGTAIPISEPLALTAEFAEDAGKQVEWQGFLKRSKLIGPPAPTLAAIIELLRSFLLPLLLALGANTPFEMQWHAGGPWQSTTAQPTS